MDTDIEFWSCGILNSGIPVISTSIGDCQNWLPPLGENRSTHRYNNACDLLINHKRINTYFLYIPVQ